MGQGVSNFPKLGPVSRELTTKHTEVKSQCIGDREERDDLRQPATHGPYVGLFDDGANTMFEAPFHHPPLRITLPGRFT